MAEGGRADEVGGDLKGCLAHVLPSARGAPSSSASLPSEQRISCCHLISASQPFPLVLLPSGRVGSRSLSCRWAPFGHRRAPFRSPFGCPQPFFPRFTLSSPRWVTQTPPFSLAAFSPLPAPTAALSTPETTAPMGAFGLPFPGLWPQRSHPGAEDEAKKRLWGTITALEDG